VLLQTIERRCVSLLRMDRAEEKKDFGAGSKTQRGSTPVEKARRCPKPPSPDERKKKNEREERAVGRRKDEEAWENE
jgi:hypothetical protein